MQNFGKAALRVTKNYTKGYSDTQAKVREATSNDPWGPSGTQMNEIAQLTYNQNDFIEIMEMIDKRLNDKGKNWRHVFKSLTVLDYLLHQGSENVVIYFRDNIYIIKTLKEFQFVDEEGKDQGANVRQKAKDITNLLQDEDRLREERRSRASMRDRMIRGVGGSYDDNEPEDENARRRDRNLAGKRGGGGRDESDELKKAIEESKKSLAQEMRKKEEDELKEALKLSEQEEAKRQKDVENSNAQSLFDDQSMPSPYPRADPTPYAVGLQPQMTSLQPQFTAMPMQPQFTSFNPYQQQAEQEAAQAEFLRQQQLFMMQQQQAQQQQAQQEEWMRQQMMQQQMQQQQQAFQQQQQTGLFPQTPQIQVQPTGFGSNNPFAPSPSPSQFSQNSSMNSSNGNPSRGTTPSFNLQGTYDNHNNSNLSSLSSRPESTPSPSISANPYTGKAINVKTKKNLGENEQQLEHLFANRDDGQDTFGNVGALRYGYTDAGRQMIAQQKTGSHNPFAKQQQQQSNDKPFFDI